MKPCYWESNLGNLDKTVNSTPCQKYGEELSASPTITWWLLGLAVCFEIAGAIGLRFSKGFTVPLPTVLALVAFTAALHLLSRVMRYLPVSVAYPIWAGGGTAGAALLSVLALHEKAGLWKGAGVVMVVAGIIVLNVGSTGHGA